MAKNDASPGVGGSGARVRHRVAGPNASNGFAGGPRPDSGTGWSRLVPYTGAMPETRYITTPIYYVNDAPHIGHCYTTTVADVVSRAHRLMGRDTFFLTGTDEHAEKVVNRAAENGLSPLEWADRNAAAFEQAFGLMDCEYEDFIRTSQPRHVEKVEAYVRRLMESGDVYLGNYEGWFDPSQEEYLTETEARKSEFMSPVTGKPLEKRVEQNYFFRLSAYADRLQAHIDANPSFILPDARRNEVLGRLRDGLQDVPVSRAVKEGDADWGILMPGDDSHRIYVWIDALFNYLSTMDTDERRRYWPAAVHFIAKDILWFHAVIWPCMLMALDEGLPGTIYSHSYWIAEGRKMSKSLGNFIELERLERYVEKYSVDALRWYLTTNGPLGATDSDFAHANFVEVYNADLANGIGNATSRVGNMIAKYFDGAMPDPKGVTSLEDHDWPALTKAATDEAVACLDRHDIAGMMRAGMELSRKVDGYINLTAPFKLAKTVGEDPGAQDRLGAILYHCAEALRVCTLILSPAMPSKMASVWASWSCEPRSGAGGGGAGLSELARWDGPHALRPGAPIEKGAVLFQRDRGATLEEPLG